MRLGPLLRLGGIRHLNLGFAGGARSGPAGPTSPSPGLLCSCPVISLPSGPGEGLRSGAIARGNWGAEMISYFPPGRPEFPPKFGLPEGFSPESFPWQKSSSCLEKKKIYFCKGFDSQKK